MSLVKYRLKEVATDFGVAPKVIADIISKYFQKPKSNTQVLTDEELNLVFDSMTQTHQIASLEQVFAVKPAPKAEPPKPAPQPAPTPAPAKRPEPPKQDRPRPPKPPRPEKPKTPAAPRTYAPAESGSVEEKIEVFIKGLLEHMDSNAVPHCWKDEGNTYKVDLVGDDLGYLIGRRGDTLDAIQHLTNYTVNRDVEGHIRVNVDAECYREKREESLRRYARKKAQQVLKARHRTTLEPMNAYERHVIHAALQDMENITTHSTGVEPNRRVVIEYVR